ncbi:toprim domain-containing protein [Actinomadura bangladeshensis]|uniref:Toprim domain-containing protein n=1 Tax=Actinomadura bangladeshensis TaxID=453573 RepID=A0A4R4P8Q9_9ACTN|nr:toprim domain-containing protein [Actinomadura bangladeshensis]TDC17237.1 toprim domain-containing protein [Actinomadura bangladeshensis]
MTTSQDEQLAQAEERRRRLSVLQGIADHAVASLADGRLPWDTWLTHASRHGRYGFTNTLLIPAQRPSATDVRSYDAWQKQGRQVRRGETDIRIISTRGKPRTVFDIEQTNGQAIERNECTPAEGLHRLSRLAADLDFYVDRGQGWTYLGRPGRRIQVPPELDESAAASLLAHQLAHALCPGGRIDAVSADSAACHGVRRVMADSVAYLVLAELGLPVVHLSFPSASQWAGTDVRSDSSAAIRAVGDQIVRTSTRIRRRLTKAAAINSGSANASPRLIPEKAAHSQGDAPPARSAQQYPDVARADLQAALAAAHHFFRRNLPGSWGARYLIRRGFTATMQEQWEIGLAPRARQPLLHHLRQLGHHEQTLVEAGLAKRSDNGDLFDLFRDRVMFPLRDQDGEVVGFIGRRRDDAPGPKYLNTPDTEVFRKGVVLFGLHEARAQLVRNARPLLVEGPLDAIAVNATLPETYAAIAPCGTAITTSHIETLAAHTDLPTSGLAIALDGDPAGRAGVIRAWRTLRNITGPVDVAVLPQGQDPAELLSTTRHSSVRESLLSVTPLADLLVDEKLQRFGGALEFVESRVTAAQAAAAMIAELQPDQIGRQVTRVAARTGMAPAEITALVASAISPDPAPTGPDVSLPPPPDVRSPRDAAPSKRPDTHRRTA